MEGDSGVGMPIAREGIELAEALGDSREVAVSKVVLAGLSTYAGIHDEVDDLVEDAHLLATRIGDRWTLGWAETFRGILLRLRAKLDLSREASLAALEHFDAVGDEHGRVLSLISLGHLAVMCEEYGEALARARESLMISRRTGDSIMSASAMSFVARVLLMRGETQGVRGLLRDANGRMSDTPNAVIVQAIAESAMFLDLAEGNHRRAAYLAGIADAIRLRAGLAVAPADIDRHDDMIATLATRLGPSAFGRQVAAGRDLSPEEIGEALTAALAAQG
jgi:hypothetical protein